MHGRKAGGELGLNWNGIDSGFGQTAGPSDPACLPGLRATYQYRNQTSVRIYGAEWRGTWRFLPQWRVDGAVAYAHGNNEQTGQPLNSVSPLRASAGLSWERTPGRGAGIRWRGARPVTRTDDTSFTYFKPSGYGVVDLQAWWRFHRYVSVALSVNNLFDKKYWLWGDVRQTGVAATEPGWWRPTATRPTALTTSLPHSCMRTTSTAAVPTSAR